MHYYAFSNGQILPYKDLYFHISDIGFQRGYAIFDYFGIRNGKIMWKDDYFERFYNSAAHAHLNVPLTPKELEEIVLELVEKNQAPTSYIKLLLSGGSSENGFDYSGESSFSMMHFEYKERDASLYEHGSHLITEEYVRPSSEIKTTNYFMSASQYEKRRQFQATDVLYHQGGSISETSRANFYMIKGREIFTPIDHVLYGITRKQFLKAMDGFAPVHVGDVKLDDVMKSDGAFITSTTKAVLPIVSIDGKAIANGEIGDFCRTIMSHFDKYIDQYCV